MDVYSTTKKVQPPDKGKNCWDLISPNSLINLIININKNNLFVACLNPSDCLHRPLGDESIRADNRADNSADNPIGL